ncbi:MAG TPA: hypothetical protein VMS17_30505 [Gemmataceae bacterium]|nr:hypothetical protein [Gemmataceae bacterium]
MTEAKPAALIKGFAIGETQVVMTGTLQPDGALVLDERPSLPPGRVRVTMQVIEPATGPEDGFITRMERVWADQKARGHVPRTREEIDAEINALRDEAEEEMQAIERLHEECIRSREQQRPAEDSGE